MSHHGHGHAHGNEHRPHVTPVRDREDPSSWWTVLNAAVGCLALVASVYWVSAAYYRADGVALEELVVGEKRVDLELYRGDQAALLERRGERTTEDGVKAKVIPIEEAMRLVVAEETAQRGKR